MNNEHLETSEELKQLREDYSALKTELERERIINENLMNSAFKRNVRTIMFDKKLSLVGGAVGAVFFPTIGFLYSTPFIYVAILEILDLFIVAATIVLYRKYDLDKIPFSDVLNASKTMKNYKKAYTRMTFATWIAFFAVLAYFCPRMIENWSTPSKATCAIVFLAIIVIFGLFVEFRYSKKIMDSCDSIIKGLDGSNE